MEGDTTPLLALTGNAAGTAAAGACKDIAETLAGALPNGCGIRFLFNLQKIICQTGQLPRARQQRWWTQGNTLQYSKEDNNQRAEATYDPVEVVRCLGSC